MLFLICPYSRSEAFDKRTRLGGFWRAWAVPLGVDSRKTIYDGSGRQKPSISSTAQALSSSTLSLHSQHLVTPFRLPQNPFSFPYNWRRSLARLFINRSVDALGYCSPSTSSNSIAIPLADPATAGPINIRKISSPSLVTSVSAPPTFSPDDIRPNEPHHHHHHPRARDQQYKDGRSGSAEGWAIPDCGR